MNENPEYVQICITCCKINNENKKTLPMICPKIQMPCLAIEPKYLIPKIDENFIKYLAGYNIAHNTKENRVPIDSKYIDKNFVESRCAAFDDLQKKGMKTIVAMEAY